MSLIGGLVLCAIGALLVLAGIRRLFTAISLSRSEATPIRRVANGDDLVEFEGRAEPRADVDAFEAPFSGEEALCCAVWLETADRHRTDVEGVDVLESKPPTNSQNSRRSWLLAESDEHRRSFVVTDGGARVAVDPADADLAIDDHMGEAVLTVDAGEPLPEAVSDRLTALDRADDDFDGSPETWDRETDRARYREARLEPGDPVHVANAAVRERPDEWGAGIVAEVGPPATDDRYLLSRGTESSVVRDHLVQFVTGVAVGLVALGIGLYAMGVLG